MADDPKALAQLHKALCGSEKVGEYPDTLVNHLNTALDAAWDLVNARGLSATVIAGTELGPWVNPTTVLGDAREQVLSRFRFDAASKPRTLAEAARQLEALMAVLTEESAPGPSTGGALPAGTSQGELLWAPDHSKADSNTAGYWANVQRQAGGGSIQNSNSPVPIVNAPYGMGRALKFTIGAKTTRLEVNPAENINSFSSGERWFGFPVAFEKDFPVGAPSWQLIAQLHGNDTVSPKFALQVNHGELRLGDSKTICPVTTGRRYNIVMRAELSAGYVTVWVDGVKKLDRFHCGTSATPYYLKFGCYHDYSIAGGTVYHGPHRIGTGYGAVFPA